jgi:hypothetical protein
MRVFIGWSGPRSRAVATGLRDWMKKVIQCLDPWMSDKDIESGARWYDELSVALKGTQFGIICLTPENREAAWVNFEAGAVCNAVTGAHVCPYLYGLEPADILQPLAQFQSRRANKHDTHRLMATINELLDVRSGIPKTEFDEVFEHWWPKLETKLQSIPNPSESLLVPSRRPDEVAGEILDHVRELRRNQAFWGTFMEAFLQRMTRQPKGKNKLDVEFFDLFLRKFARAQEVELPEKGILTNDKIRHMANQLMGEQVEVMESNCLLNPHEQALIDALAELNLKDAEARETTQPAIEAK